MSLRLWIVAIATAACLHGCLNVDRAVADNLATCVDGVSNGMETDVDCGGPDCASCLVGGACIEHADCALEECIDGFCAAPACDDGRLNQEEADVDCGGPCEPCEDGFRCRTGADCASQVCADATCLVGVCGDGVRQEGEACDPGALATKSCDADCTLPACGDGEFNPAAEEECDDGNDAVHDGCTPECTIERTLVFEFTGSVATYVVPPAVSEIRLEAYGASGAGEVAGMSTGGTGGYAAGTLFVRPGQELFIRVGGDGDDEGGSGFNGGGHATAGCLGGGGASDVRVDGQELADRVLVAGGGGGGGLVTSAFGGAGGGLNGASASRLSSSSCLEHRLGRGGTQFEGGAHGGEGNGQASAGALGLGGACDGFLSASGGGGYYGGGGGGAPYCGGGGGSSYVGGLTDAQTSAGGNVGHGRVVLTVLD